VAREITRRTGLGAYKQDEFSRTTIGYYIENTGIPINFGISVFLGFLVGTAIVGQTFYNFTADNIRHFGALKAMGAGNLRLLGMILLQAAIVGVQGYGLGVLLASWFGMRTAGTELAFKLTWVHLVITAVAVLLISMLSAIFSLVKVMRTEPAIVFKG
jgi:putative ABC transport system permease protein